MQTRTYQLYATTTQANAANVSIIAPGYIHAIIWSAYVDSNADNGNFQLELSFQSASQISTHNALGIIDAIAFYQNMVTSGFSESMVNKSTVGLYIPVGIGQIVYLNTAGAATGSWKAIMHVIER